MINEEKFMKAVSKIEDMAKDDDDVRYFLGIFSTLMNISVLNDAYINAMTEVIGNALNQSFEIQKVFNESMEELRG